MDRKFAPNTFCSSCGTKFDNLGWPRQCQNCGFTVWNNPTSVTLVLAPTQDGGLFVIQRGHKNDPGYGGWAHVGGFRLNVHTWQKTGSTEWWEETSIPGVIPSRILHFDTTTAHQKKLDVITGVIDGFVNPKRFVPSEECPDYKVIYPGQENELVFHNNQVLARKWFTAKGYLDANPDFASEYRRFQTLLRRQE